MFLPTSGPSYMLFPLQVTLFLLPSPFSFPSQSKPLRNVTHTHCLHSPTDCTMASAPLSTETIQQKVIMAPAPEANEPILNFIWLDLSECLTLLTTLSLKLSLPLSLLPILLWFFFFLVCLWMIHLFPSFASLSLPAPKKMNSQSFLIGTLFLLLYSFSVGGSIHSHGMIA